MFLWFLSEMLYEFFPYLFYGGILLLILFFTILKKGKIVLICILALLFSFVYIDRYPTRYPFEDDWILGKTREEILQRYEDRYAHIDDDKITYHCHGYFSYGGKNWWAHREQGVDIEYEYTIYFDETGTAKGIEYWSHG